MDATSWLELGAGLVLLVAGAECLVRGSSRLAQRVGISPLVIGLTIVAYGTSAPELLVSATAVLEGRDQIAVGNVVGSNIFNVLVILGLCALVRPLVVAQQLVFRDIPVMISVSLLLLFFGLDGRVGVGEGMLLCVGAIAFTVDSVRASRRESAAIRSEYEASLQRATVGRGRLVDMGLVAARWALLDLSRAVAERAEGEFPVEPIRTLDALHLSSALVLREAIPDLVVLSTDDRLRANALELGFAAIPE
jgi:Ca2+/Na+ antiporter